LQLNGRTALWRCFTSAASILERAIGKQTFLEPQGASPIKVRDISLSALFILESVERSGSLSKAAAEEDVSRARVTLALQRLDLQFGFAMLKADPLGKRTAAIRSISLTSLCTLESVGRTGGLSEAAIEEGLTLPGVGQAIARLEQHLGPLVTRRQDDSRRRVLTERGQRIALITRRFRAELQGVLDCDGEPPLSN
jgi:DNA-binding transcriptional LysR family regulator